MIVNKYGTTIDNVDFELYLVQLKNKIYKLLPLREEQLEWQKYLTSVLIELDGLNTLLVNQVYLLSLMSKLEGLFKVEDFMVYRRTIFESLNIVDELRPKKVD